MYIINKLQKLYEVEGTSQVDGELSYYFLSHLKNLKHMTLKRCVEDTGISKASIHRFFSRAGFVSFKEMIKELYKEYNIVLSTHLEDISRNELYTLFDHCHFDMNKVTQLAKSINDASRLAFYGSSTEINMLTSTLSILRKKQKMYRQIDCWNQTNLYDCIKELDKNDILIIIDSSMQIDILKEASLNQNDMLQFNKIKSYHFQKYYIGSGCKSVEQDFEVIEIAHQKKQYIPFVLVWFDNLLATCIEKELV